ncbi:MAG: hypothetical protein RAK18_06800, partial [Conexivisphaerales archaeon]|nr:hypothetical protein [Conexivisphaerales archaeon]
REGPGDGEGPGLKDGAARLGAPRTVRALDGASMDGRDPMGLAAGAVYLAAGAEGVKATQRDLAEASGLTEITVRRLARFRGIPAGSERMRTEVPTSFPP